MRCRGIWSQGQVHCRRIILTRVDPGPAVPSVVLSVANDIKCVEESTMYMMEKEIAEMGTRRSNVFIFTHYSSRPTFFHLILCGSACLFLISPSEYFLVGHRHSCAFAVVWNTKAKGTVSDRSLAFASGDGGVVCQIQSSALTIRWRG